MLHPQNADAPFFRPQTHDRPRKIATLLAAIVADILVQRPKPKDTVDNIICVNHVPIIPEEKYSKLEAVIKKTFGKVGKVLDIHMPMDEKDMTKGFCFVEYEDAEQVCVCVC